MNQILGVFRASLATRHPQEPIIEPWLDAPFPDYDHEPVFVQN